MQPGRRQGATLTAKRTRRNGTASQQQPNEAGVYIADGPAKPDGTIAGKCCQIRLLALPCSLLWFLGVAKVCAVMCWTCWTLLLGALPAHLAAALCGEASEVIARHLRRSWDSMLWTTVAVSSRILMEASHIPTMATNDGGDDSQITLTDITFRTCHNPDDAALTRTNA